MSCLGFEKATDKALGQWVRPHAPTFKEAQIFKWWNIEQESQ